MMRHRILRSTIDVLLAIGLATIARAAVAYDFGSNGSYGDITLAAHQELTIPLPADGVVHATTLSMAYGSILRFTRNELNTPAYVLCTGDVATTSNSLILVSGSGTTGLEGGRGGPGGYDGGDSAKDALPAGNGHGPGGGAAGVGSPGGRGNHAGMTDPVAQDGSPYGGPLQMPLIGGSGGGGHLYGGGGGGGGAILLASNTSIRIDGSIDARGAGNGAGGGIRLLAPKVSGTGNLYVDMGVAGGKGRIRVDTLDPFDMRLNFYPLTARTVGTVMMTWPPAGETLELARIGTHVIPPGSPPATVIFGDGSPTSQEIQVRATNFTGQVAVDVVLTPRHGPRVVYPVTINMGGSASATATVQAEFVRNMVTRVDVWTRPD